MIQSELPDIRMRDLAGSPVVSRMIGFKPMFIGMNNIKSGKKRKKG